MGAIVAKRRTARVTFADVVRVLPRRAHDLSRRTVRESQRWRLLEAITEAVGRRGYPEASVADVIAIAGVSRKTFYEHFRDKEECFLAAFQTLSERMLDEMIAASSLHPPGPARRRAYLECYLRRVVSDRLAARVFHVEVAAAGPKAQRLSRRIETKFAQAYMGDVASSITATAITGGVNRAVVAELVEPSARALPDLLDELATYVERALGVK